MNSAGTVASLQQRISEMQPLELDDRALPTAAGLRPLLPGGALRRGSSYAVKGSRQLALALLAEPSAAGSWCGIIGCDTLGAEAAASLGVALDRCAVVPRPGEFAVGIAGSLAEVVTVVLLAAPRGTRSRVSGGDAERIAARLREHGSALVVLGDWPRTESVLRVTSSRWHGLGAGSGLLGGRDLTVESHDRRGVRQHTVRFGDGPVQQVPRTAPPVLVPL
ncbi:hypothetical protein [Leucobacter sp. GX0328]